MPTDTRTIQYYGIIEPSQDFKQAKRSQLLIDLRRDALTNYQNGKYRPQPQTFFGYISAVKDDKVLQVYRMSYPNQIIFDYFNEQAFLFNSIKCAIDTINQSISNLGNALGQPTVSIENPLNSWSAPLNDVDYYDISLYDKNIIVDVTLSWEIQESSCVSGLSKPTNYSSPTHLQNPSVVPPNTPDSGAPTPSAPYMQPDDNGLTYNPNSSNPSGNSGQLYNIKIILYDSSGNILSEDNEKAFGPIGGAYVAPPGSNPTVGVYCEGFYFSGTDVPQNYGLYFYNGRDDRIVRARVEIVS